MLGPLKETGFEMAGDVAGDGDHARVFVEDRRAGGAQAQDEGLATRELRFGETYVNREHFEAMQGFHAGRRKSGIGGADGRHGLYEYTETQVVYLQTQ